MDSITLFVSVFLLIFFNELGDKSQLATGTSALVNRSRTRLIFFSSALALTTVSGLTVLGAGFITWLFPESILPLIKQGGGLFLALYGVYLIWKANAADNSSDEQESSDGVGWSLFLSHFVVVFLNELGDKTQFATLGSALGNQGNATVVFAASASALIAVTGLVVWGVTKVPAGWVKAVQLIGAISMIAYGTYMLLA